MTSPDPTRAFLRHTVATLAYRGGKAVCGALPLFETFAAGGTTRPAGRILAHIGDLLDWALSMAKGEEAWKGPEPRAWAEEVERFHAALRAFDGYLESDAPLAVPGEKLFQGPIADALTHVGQIAILRRLAGSPIRGENYFKAEITVGRVGPDQAVPRREFE